MERFHIIQADPMQYKAQILKFWKDYLPDTPPSRLDWMENGNPAGPAIWFFAFDSKTNELAGIISVMPKEFFMNGQHIRAGILGDFMVSSKYRIFGPNLQLPRYALNDLSKYGFKFIYTMPNPASEKIIQRVGFHNAGAMHSLIKPLDIKYYLAKKINSFPVNLLAPFIDVGLRIISRESYILTKACIEEVSEIDDSFDIFWKEVILKQSNLIGIRSSAYLNWRYFKNPLYKFRILSYRQEPQGKLLGFLCFKVNQNKLYIFDIVALHKKYIHQLLKHITKIGSRERCISINIDIFNSNPLMPILKSFRYFDAKNNIKLFLFGEKENLFENCHFLGGDRNI